jgi:hypothetical protein
MSKHLKPRKFKPSQALMDSRNITPERRVVLEEVYSLLNGVLNRPDLHEDPVEFLTGLEYTVQVLWGFEPDCKKHSYHNLIKGCTCPNGDNMDLLGTGLRWTDAECPFHGKKSEVK